MDSGRWGNSLNTDMHIISRIFLHPSVLCVSFAFLLLCLLVPFTSYSQKHEHGNIGFILPRDKVRLKNGDAETGKVIRIDSARITLRKYDYSEKNILRSSIDSIYGLSFFTYFISPSIGPMHWKGMISQRLDTFSADVSNLNVRLGTMRRKHWAFYGDLARQGGKNDLKLFHVGAGVRYYFPLNYVLKKSTYVGFDYGYNFPQTNEGRFRDITWSLGYEYFLLEKYRLFIEFDRTHAQKFTPKPAAYSFNFGMRFSLEYLNFYEKYNSKK